MARNVLKALEEYVENNVNIGEVLVKSGDKAGAFAALETLALQKSSFEQALRNPGRILVEQNITGGRILADTRPDKALNQRRIEILDKGINKLKAVMKAKGWL